MKRMKRFVCFLLMSVMVLTVGLTAACSGGGESGGGSDSDKYTVTFYVEGEVYETQSVSSGKRATKPEDPEFSDSSKVFTGWFTEETFENEWNFTTGMVTSDLDLYAGYNVITAYPSSLALADEALTSSLVWVQAALSGSGYSVSVTDSDGNTSALSGTATYDEDSYLVTFTPETVPQGGLYDAVVTDGAYPDDPAEASGLLFRGAGTESNPYLIADALDVTAISQSDVDANTYYSLYSDVTVSSDRAAQTGYTFNGTLSGNGKTITMSGSNSALLYTIGAYGSVSTLTIEGAVSTSLYDSIGTVADYNYGRVEKVPVTATVTSTAGTAGSNGLSNALDETLADGSGSRGIAGGVVGTNCSGGTVYNCKIKASSSSTGVVKASIGGGCIVGYNKTGGTVELCVSEGCLGAYNSTESGGKSLSTYSYSGGVVGINAGTVTDCTLEGSGKLLAQRYTDTSELVEGSNNSNLGGIAGYNMNGGTITSCAFSGIRVHGDENVGGIAGNNEGTIKDCLAEGIYFSTTGIVSYVGGRTNVGGIAGANTGTISYCVSTANVFGYTEGTAYSIAPTSSNCLYIAENANDRSDGAVSLSVSGSNNTAMSDLGATGSSDVLIPESYLTYLDDAFVFDTTAQTIKLDITYPDEESVDVALYYADGTYWKTVSVSESGSSIAGPTLSGYIFSGWSLTEGGEADFASGETITYYDLIDYVSESGTAALYAVFTERTESSYDLVVGVWTRYITSDESTELYNAYLSYLGDAAEDISISFVLYEETAVKDFGAAVNADGDVDVLVGVGSNITSSGGVATVARAAIDYDVCTYFTSESSSGRQAALLTENTWAISFYSYVTGIEDASAEVTLSAGESSVTTTLSSILLNAADLPDYEVDGVTFAGWALTEDGEAVITGTTITYSTVSEYLGEDGTLTLYAVYSEIEYDIVVGVCTNWISEDEANAVVEAYLGTLSEDINVLVVAYEQTTVAKLGEAVNSDGNVDVLIGVGNNITSTGGVETLARTSLDYTVYAYATESRQAALLTEGEYAVDFYAYITGQTNAEAEVTLSAGDSTATTTLSSILLNTAELPDYEVDGATFAGWALSADGEAVITETTITYSTVSEYLGEDGTLTLYAVYSAETEETEDAGTEE